MGHHARQRQLDLRRQLLFLGRQGHTQLLLDLLAVGIGHVLGNVCLHGRHDLGRPGVLPHQLRNDRVLHGRGVHLNVGLVVLIHKRLERLALEGGHVLRHRVLGLLVLGQWHQLVGVLDTQHLQHATVQLGQIVDVRSRLGKLDHCLVLHHALAQGGRVRVAHRDHVHVVVVRAFGARCALVRLVVVVLVRVVADQVTDQLQLFLERVVHARLHGRHDLELALQQSQCGAYRCLRRHVGDLHVCCRGKATAFFHDRVEQVVQGGRRLFVRQRQDVVFERARAHVGIAELARSDRSVVALDPQTTGLQAAGQVGQRAGVDQLTHQAGRAVGEPTDQVEQSKAVGAKAGDVLVVHEVLALQAQGVILAPVATDGQHGVLATDESHHVRQHDAGGLAILALVAQRVALDAQVHVALDQGVAIVVQIGKTRLLVLGLVDLINVLVRRADVHVAVEAGRL